MFKNILYLVYLLTFVQQRVLYCTIMKCFNNNVLDLNNGSGKHEFNTAIDSLRACPIWLVISFHERPAAAQ